MFVKLTNGALTSKYVKLSHNVTLIVKCLKSKLYFNKQMAYVMKYIIYGVYFKCLTMYIGTITTITV